MTKQEIPKDHHCTCMCIGPVCKEKECDVLCYHMYTCDHYCYDYMSGHICKHIHKVHSATILSSSSSCVEDMNDQNGNENVILDLQVDRQNLEGDTPNISYGNKITDSNEEG